jgi:hypothetical protein
MATPKRIICKEFVKIGQCEIRYVQPNPLPPFLQYMQQARTEGLDFVKIPISDKEDKLYLRSAISHLLSQTGIHWDFVEKLIKTYNAPPTPNPAPAAVHICASTPPEGIPSAAAAPQVVLAPATGPSPREKARASLLNLVQLTKHLAEEKNFEFLTETE